ncbi:MAG: nicotinate-nicotinamide nucleotide adenylyltransferase, partial [Ignavibacteriaceae bacterium]|nr:nicotinate-nicotinamide nucleotide adenylyltransferase [Ignavibacteriaceae bacterium]
TLKSLKKVYSNIELIIGFDNLLVFEKWKNPDEIFELSTVVVLNRKTEGTATKNKYFDKAVFVETPTIEISSTEIRNRVSKNQTIEFLVPQGVKEYIYKNKLYT